MRSTMSKIELEQISENEVEVLLPPDTPMETVHQLTKGLAARGLIEDLAKSTVSVRYFYRTPSKVDDIANQLIKSLEVMTGSSKATSIQKSNYGPKKGGQYTPVDNVRRKMNNVGDVAGQGPNVNVKAISTKPGQLSAKASADLTARIQAKANKRQPVKVLSEEEKSKIVPQTKFKKGWDQHLPFPNAEEEMAKINQMQSQTTEDLMAQQLANMMNGKAMLGQKPPSQPTDEEMFGAGVVTEEMAKTAENKWNNTFNNWMVEASKPISQRFSSEQEELAYWKNIKASGGGDDGAPGF